MTCLNGRNEKLKRRMWLDRAEVRWSHRQREDGDGTNQTYFLRYDADKTATEFVHGDETSENVCGAFARDTCCLSNLLTTLSSSANRQLTSDIRISMIYVRTLRAKHLHWVPLVRSSAYSAPSRQFRTGASMPSSYSLSDLNYISREDLYQLIPKPSPVPAQSTSASTSAITPSPPPLTPSIKIIDVRDRDHIGGHIRHSIHIPSSQLDVRIPELVQALHADGTTRIVVFHCMLSQERGPRAALRFLRERERLYPSEGQGGLKRSGLAATTAGAVAKQPGESEGEGDQEEPCEISVAGTVSGVGRSTQPRKGDPPEVYVLRGGFGDWQAKYGRVTTVTEGWVEDVWRDD